MFVLRVYAIYQGSKKIIVASLALAAVLVPIAAVSPFLKCWDDVGGTILTDFFLTHSGLASDRRVTSMLFS